MLRRVRYLFAANVCLSLLACAASNRSAELDALPQAAQALCDQLLNPVAVHNPRFPKSLAVGNLYYKDTEFLSEFSALFQSEILTALHPRLRDKVVSREDLVRSIGKADVVMELLDVVRVSEGMGEVPDAQITGQYWPSADNRTVRLQVMIKGLGKETGKVLATASGEAAVADLHLRLMPENLLLAQAGLLDAQEVGKIIRPALEGKQNFRISLWLEDAKRLWRGGEKLVVYFRAERDCHLNLIHTAADGSVQLLFPNKFHSDNFVTAGQVYAIPDAQMAFDFEISPPYGVETILAVATIEDNQALYVHTTESGDPFSPLPNGVRGITVNARKTITLTPSDQKAWALITFTTISK